MLWNYFPIVDVVELLVVGKPSVIVVVGKGPQPGHGGEKPKKVSVQKNGVSVIWNGSITMNLQSSHGALLQEAGRVEVEFVLVLVGPVLVDVLVPVPAPETDQAIIQNAERNNPIRVLRETLLLRVNFIVIVDKGENSKNIKRSITSIGS